MHDLTSQHTQGCGTFVLTRSHLSRTPRAGGWAWEFAQCWSRSLPPKPPSIMYDGAVVHENVDTNVIASQDRAIEADRITGQLYVSSLCCIIEFATVNGEKVSPDYIIRNNDRVSHVLHRRVMTCFTSHTLRHMSCIA